ncbi:MAG: phosphatidylserine decarboxylase [Deltaproteobacteria bacterium]|nr:phosphatidylserine decarboxylase [Deltaproteobacteria bacterium]
MSLNRERFPFVVEGMPFIIPPAVITMIAGVWGKSYLLFPFLALTICMCSFFRNPRRRITDGAGLILSPADGTIVGVKKEAGGTTVSIFMSVFNCHVNRAPAAGTIKSIRYRRGMFLPANKGEASRQNEQNAFQLQTPEGLKVRFVQVAGIIARRIVCYMRKGDQVKRGGIVGAILFGSRVDVYLPPRVAVRVHEGERVKGGKSVLGMI